MDLHQVIGAQLTLKAVVLDIDYYQEGRGEEFAKLEAEIDAYGIAKLTVGRTAVRQTPALRLAGLRMLLDEHHIAQAGAVLVTQDTGFGSLVQECTDITVVYDEGDVDTAPIAGQADAAPRDENGDTACAVFQKDQGDAAGAVFQKDQGDAVSAVFQEDREGATDAAFQEEPVSASCGENMVVQGFWEVGIQFLDRMVKRRLHLPWNILYTARTIVREICLADLDELYELYGGEGITDYMEPLYEREQEEAYTRDYINCMYYYYGYGMWIVRDRLNGCLIGRAGIDHREEGGYVNLELGYLIAKEYQNQGYATEVCNAILRYAAKELAVDVIYSYIHPDNAASIRVARKLGFVYQKDVWEGARKMECFIKKLGLDT